MFLTEYISTYILYTVIFDLTQRGWHTSRQYRNWPVALFSLFRPHHLFNLAVTLHSVQWHGDTEIIIVNDVTGSSSSIWSISFHLAGVTEHHEPMRTVGQPIENKTGHVTELQSESLPNEPICLVLGWCMSVNILTISMSKSDTSTKPEI